MNLSKFLTLNQRDFIKGLLVAVLGAIVAGAYQVFLTHMLPTAAQWQSIGISGLEMGSAYLLKNFFTNSNDKVLTKETPK